jgi:tetratricopeptide (TPR) repeat protein
VTSLARAAVLLACATALAEPATPATTDGAIAMGNLESQLASTRQAVARFRRDDDAAALVALLLAHAQVAGRLDEYDEALRVAEELAARAPRANALVLRAQARAALHRFAEAAADLDAAARAGAPASALDGLRASVAQAAGRDDEALALRRRAADAAHDPIALGEEAALLGELGRRDEAARTFDEAFARATAVSPFPRAWLDFQRGLFEERCGNLPQARAHHQAALARLPGFAAAAGHLAAVEAASGGRDRAASLLEPLLDRSDDPEWAAQLADLLAASAPPRAAALADRARARYEALLARHPEAFTAAAIRFFLGAGHDPRRAHALATRHLAAHPTRDAFALAIDAALAAHDPAAACRAATRASSLEHVPPPLHLARARAFAACKRDHDAALELQRAR